MSTNHIDQLLEAIKEGTVTIRHKDGSQWQLDPADKQTICSGLEKQIAKKPIIEIEMKEMDGDKYAVWQCPSCKCRHYTECGIKYCSKCGQAIYFSEVEG